MKRRSILRRIAAAAVCLLLALSLPQTALAYSQIPDIDRECTLTLQHKFPGTTFHLYRIASVTRDVEFTLVQDLAGSNVTLKDLNQEGWRGAALALAGYVEREQMTPLRTGQTDENGRLTFDKLPTGLYLVVGVHETRDGMEYHFTPFLICLPNWLAPADNPNGEKDWTYDVTMNTKYEEREPDQEMRRVLKIWNDGGQVQNRPAQISVDLLRDGEIYDTAILTADTNWRHVWEELDTGYDWRVVESAGGAGYTVSVGYEGVTFLITNTAGGGGDNPTDPDFPQNDPDNPPPTNPDNPTTPPDTPVTPDNPVTPETPNTIEDNPVPLTNPDVPNIPNIDEIDEPEVPLANVDPEETPEEPVSIDDPEVPLARLPQTGQLWWPVPLLAMSGMCLFFLGWAGRRKETADADR